MESCSTVQVTKWGMAPWAWGWHSATSPFEEWTLWKCLSAEWMTRLFDCRDTAEKAFTEIVPRGPLKQQSLSRGFFWWLTSKKKVIGQPAKLRASQGLPLETWGFQAVKELQNLFPGNYAALAGSNIMQRYVS